MPLQTVAVAAARFFIVKAQTILSSKAFGRGVVRLSSRLSFICTIVCLALTAAFRPATAEEYSDGEKIFALKVSVIIREKCIACHGGDPEDISGGFDMRSRQSLIRGGDQFEDDCVILGKGEQSGLYAVVARTESGMEMPPKESEALTESQAWAFRDWIDADAPWPSKARIAAIKSEYASGVLVSTSGGLDETWTNRRYESAKLWSYRPLQEFEIADGVHPVDHFIDARLDEIGLAASASADGRTVARRLAFTLTGLPPTAEDVVEFHQAYMADPQQAVESFIDQLLRSPHYGEHFAQHWLDVTRYADTGGFANDYTRPNAWRYRDYVIAAFNGDKPYDQFVRQQIAGDEIDDTNPENLIATGFLRMGPWEQTSMSVFQVTRGQWLDDVTDSVGQTFLAHPLQCAKCHDHKFDPIPTRDYYSMMAVFSTTQFAERDAAFLDRENQNSFEQTKRWTAAKIEAYEKDQRELLNRVEQSNVDRSVNDTPASNQSTVEKEAVKTSNESLSGADEASLARIRKNIQRHSWELQRTEPIAYSVYTGKTVARKTIQSRIKRPSDPWAKGYFKDDVIHDGGDIFSPGASVRPGAVSAASMMSELDYYELPNAPENRRLSLANWIVDQRNPLTARVIVNRVWSWHFGRGIAGNPNNFGGTGELPTHPQLLDHLAGWFMQNGWSIKKLNRLLLSSTAFRRSTDHPRPDHLAKTDPTNQFRAVATPRRMSAEEIRDAMLSCTGELNEQVGGVPCRPEMNIEVATQPRTIMGGQASVYEPDATPSLRNRRTIYTEKIRGLRDPFLETFNQPSPDNSCERRETSIVATQALTLIHSAAVSHRALALADRLVKAGASDDPSVINKAFDIVLQRPPTPIEMDACLRRWKEASDEEQGLTPEPMKIEPFINRTVMAEKTGEPYDFVETMPTYHHYVYDLRRHEVDARTRGLAHVCLVLLNGNEFLNVD